MLIDVNWHLVRTITSPQLKDNNKQDLKIAVVSLIVVILGLG